MYAIRSYYARVFQSIWKTIGENIFKYKSYPRIVGETGGKDFIFADPTADPQALAIAMVRGAFEYQGQKCSAASRAYVITSYSIHYTKLYDRRQHNCSQYCISNTT